MPQRQIIPQHYYGYKQLHLNHLHSCRTIWLQLFDLATFVTMFTPVQNQLNETQRNIIFTSQLVNCFFCSLMVLSGD